MNKDNNTKQNSWPPPYKIRFSKRAKYISLKITASAGLEIIIPSFRKRFNIPVILEERKLWIKKNLTILQQNTKPPPNTSNYLPKILPLNAIGEIWHISYIKSHNKNTKLIEKPNHLTCYGTIQAKTVQAILINWLKKHAKKILSCKLATFSTLTALPYQNLTIRGQKTLWGSCNAQQNISLNFKLLFLPPALAKYVLLHELCHTKYLNHSHKFWHLLAKYDYYYAHHDKELKNADQYVPKWVLN